MEGVAGGFDGGDRMVEEMEKMEKREDGGTSRKWWLSSGGDGGVEQVGDGLLSPDRVEGGGVASGRRLSHAAAG